MEQNAEQTDVDMAECPRCNGAGEFSESIYVYGPAALVVECQTCHGAGYLPAGLVYEMTEIPETEN